VIVLVLGSVETRAVPPIQFHVVEVGRFTGLPLVEVGKLFPQEAVELPRDAVL
jgi:hypothetical protein